MVPNGTLMTCMPMFASVTAAVLMRHCIAGLELCITDMTLFWRYEHPLHQLLFLSSTAKTTSQTNRSVLDWLTLHAYYSLPYIMRHALQIHQQLFLFQYLPQI